MKLNMSFDYKKTLKQTLEFLNKNRIIVASIIILGLGAYALNRISVLSQPEIDNTYLNSKISELKEVNFDQDAIERIQTLNSSNVNIEPEFTERNNPFGE